MLEEGLLFADRYKLVKLLGRGGFAEVWLAEDNLTAVQVAVKVYAPGTGLDEAGVKLFTQEFSMVFDMNHTNLLRPTHFDCWNRQPYLIMPYCKNGSAFKYITADNKITEDECWNLLHDVAAGLAYLHEKVPPLIHQDIKPDNILVNDEGHFMITDFGISARVRSTIRNGMAQEQSGGTLAYMGPERFSANPKPIMASDVWSLGAMMFELMTGGNPPFGNHGGVLQKNGADIPVIEEDFSQDLKDIIYACLAKETWDRPSAKKVEEITYNKLHGIVLPPEPTADENPVSQDVAETLVEEKANTVDSTPIQEPSASSVASAAVQNNQKTASASNKKMLYGGIAAAVVLIGVLVAVFSGGSSEPEQPAIVEVVEKINYDSLANVKIQQAMALTQDADTIFADEEGRTDVSKYGKVEDIYISAFKSLNEALENSDSLSVDVSTNAKLQKAEVTNKLLSLYKELDEGKAYVEEYGIRAEAIKPYIENLLENSNNDIQTDEENAN